MTRRLSMSMFASKEDLLEARISQLEADNAALMEVVRAIERIHTASGEAFVRKEARETLSALPAHIKEAAKEEAR